MLRASGRSIVVAACLCVVGAGAALADGVDVVAEPEFVPAPPMLWNSIYIGVHAGWADADASWTYNNINPYSAPGPAGPIELAGEGFSPDGFAGGGQIGFNHQLGQWLIGAEVSYSGLDLSDTHESPGNFLGAGTRTLVTTDIDSLVTVTAKLGLVVDPRWIVYLKGGYANAEVKTSGVVEGISGDDFSTSGRESGWVLGVGTEYKIMDQLGLGLEYTHVDLGGSSRVGAIAAEAPEFHIAHDVDAEIDSVMVRLNWHFNRSQRVMETFK